MNPINNLKVLTVQAMVGATQGWVSPSPSRSALEAIPEVSGSLVRMSAAHQGLLNCQLSEPPPSVATTLKQLSEEALQWDGRNDRFVRGIDAVLEGNGLVSEEDTSLTVETLQRLRKRLFPEGTSIVNRTFLEESGEVEMVKSRLTDDDWALLAGVPTTSGTLLDAVNAWIEAGTRLGVLERQRARMSEDEGVEFISRDDVRKARNQWIRVVRAILAELDLADDLDEETRILILQPLETAVAKAVEKAEPKADAPADASIAS